MENNITQNYSPSNSAHGKYCDYGCTIINKEELKDHIKRAELFKQLVASRCDFRTIPSYVIFLDHCDKWLDLIQELIGWEDVSAQVHNDKSIDSFAHYLLEKRIRDALLRLKNIGAPRTDIMEKDLIDLGVL